MLKKRIIPIQLLLAERLVKTQRFGEYRDVGDPIKSSKVYNDQYADELIFLNITRESRSIDPLLRLVEEVSAVCFMPLSLGGGIASFEDASQLIARGADKVVLNTAAYREPGVISSVADAYGSQAVIVAVDVRRLGDGWVCFSDCGRTREQVPLEQHLSAVTEAGAGEIFIQSIDNDGEMQGYDVALLTRVAERVTVPVIGAGGCGTYEHMREAFQRSGVDALACGSLFNFGDNNPIRAKAHLSNYGLRFKVV